MNYLIPWIAMSAFGIFGFLLTFNILRAHRYDKIFFVFRELPEDSKDNARTYALLGIPFNFLFTLFLFGHPKPLGYILAGLWIGFQIAFFYWYYKTRKDPFGNYKLKPYPD